MRAEKAQLPTHKKRGLSKIASKRSSISGVSNPTFRSNKNSGSKRSLSLNKSREAFKSKFSFQGNFEKYLSKLKEEIKTEQSPMGNAVAMNDDLSRKVSA